jgi:hypothetical protein
MIAKISILSVILIVVMSIVETASRVLSLSTSCRSSFSFLLYKTVKYYYRPTDLKNVYTYTEC